MDKYHITYYDVAVDNICKGINLFADSTVDAVVKFHANYPKAVFLSMMNVTKVYNDEKK